MKQVIRWMAISFAALLAGLIIVWLMVLALGVTVRLDVLRDPIQTAASRALGREVRIRGPIELRPTLGPTVVMRGLHIITPGEPDGADPLKAKRVEARLGLFALLRGRPQITALLIQDVSINLETRADGSHNWRNTGARASTDHAPSRLPPGSQAPLIRQRELRDLSLRNIVLSYRDDMTGLQYRLRLDEVSGSALLDQPLDLRIRGGMGQESWVAHLRGGKLSELLASSGSWPLQITATMAGASLALHGALDASPPEPGAEMEFELRGLNLPAAGASALRGRVAARFDTTRARSRGELQESERDAALLSATGSSTDADGSSPRHQTAGGLAGRSADVPGWLEAIGLQVEITAQEILHTPVAIRNARLRLFVQDGRLSAPLDVIIADVPFHGDLIVNRQGDGPALKLGLTATDADAGRLAGSLTGIKGIRGGFEHIGFQAATSDTGTVDLLNGIDLGLSVTGARLSYGNIPGGKPVDFMLDELAMTIPAGKEMSVSAQGALLDEPFGIEFTGGALEVLLGQEAWPVDLSATAGSTTLHIDGSLAGARDDAQTLLNLHLSGNRVGDLAGWFGVSPCAEASYTARGQLIHSENIGHLQFLQASTGNTRLNGDLDWSMDEQIPLLHVIMHFETLDPVDLDGLMPLVKSGGDVAKTGITIDMPILPKPVEIMNTDINMTMDHLLTRPIEFTDVSLSTQIRAGKAMHSPFHAHVGPTGFQGYLDPSGAVTNVVFELEREDDDSGNRLRDLYSAALRWVGSAAIVPLQWLFKKELSAEGADDCRDDASRKP